MKIEMDVEGAIKQALENAIDVNIISVAVQGRLNKLVKDIIDEQTSSYSDFGRMIRDEIKSAFPSTYSMENQSNFRDAILKIVEKNITGYRDTQLEQKLNDLMSGLLQKTPESIKLSELILQAAKMWEVSEPSVHIEVSSGITAGYTNVFLDKESGKGKYSCSCSIAMTGSGKVYSIKTHGQDMRDSLFVGPIYEFERFLFWLYTGGTTVEIDCTDIDDLIFPKSDEEGDDNDD